MGVAALKTPSGLIKIFCWALTFVLLVLARGGFDGEAITHLVDPNWLTITAVCSYTIILSVIVIAYFIGDVVPARTECLFMLVGAALFIASGSLTVERFQPAGSSDERNTGLAFGSLAIINGIVMFVDAALIGKKIAGK